METSSKPAGKLWQAAFACSLIIPCTLLADRTIADIACGLIGLLFLFHSHRARNWCWLRDPAVVTLFIAWGWLCLVVTPLAYHTGASASISLPWIRFILFYAAMRHWVLAHPQPLKLTGALLAMLLMFIAVDTVWQYVYGMSLTGNVPPESGRLTGPFDNVKAGIYLSRMLPPTLALCFFFGLQEHHRKLATVTFGAFYFFLLYTIAVTGERAPFGLTVLAAMVTLGTLTLTERRLRIPCLWLIVCIIGTVLLLIETQPWVYNRMVFTMQTLMDFGHSSYGELFQTALRIGSDHLLHGVGMRNFRMLCPDFINTHAAANCNLHPHNAYLEWFAEAGFIGLALYNAFALLLLCQCFRTLRHCRTANRLLPAFALGALTIYFFPFIPSQSFFASWPAILFWYALSVTMASLLYMGSGRLVSDL